MVLGGPEGCAGFVLLSWVDFASPPRAPSFRSISNLNALWWRVGSARGCASKSVSKSASESASGSALAKASEKKRDRAIVAELLRSQAMTVAIVAELLLC